MRRMFARFASRSLGLLLACSTASTAAQPALNNPYMSYSDRRENNVRIRIQINPVNGPVTSAGEASLYFPVPKRTGSSLAHQAGIRSQVITNFGSGPTPYEVVGDIEETTSLFPAGARYVKSTFGPITPVNFLTFEYEHRQSTFVTQFNENAAYQIGWPEKWPPEAQACFQDEALVSVDLNGVDQRESVDNQLRSIIGDNDIRQISPLTAAKYLTAELLFRFRVQAAPLIAMAPGRRQQLQTSGRVSVVDSFAVAPAGVAAQQLRGTSFTLATLWTALMRQAGIPARLVIGYDLGEDLTPGRIDVGVVGDEDPGVVVWCEFALYDEAQDILTWVPVDIFLLSQQTSAKLNYEQSWTYFGTHPFLSSLTPVAQSWVPPFAAEAYGVGLWGWDLGGSSVEAIQTITFTKFAVARDGRGNGTGPALAPAKGLASMKAPDGR